MAAPGAAEDFVFVGPHRGVLRVTLFRRRFWLPAVKAAGLDGLRIHEVRHTAVALWIAAGANPREVAARAAHASVSLTLDRYGHLYPEADLTLRERLDATWSASGGGR
jgi:integrase